MGRSNARKRVLKESLDKQERKIYDYCFITTGTIPSSTQAFHPSPEKI